jgi:hypothetical protein
MSKYMTPARKNWQRIRRQRAMKTWAKAHKLFITGKYTYPEIGAKLGVRASTAHKMVRNYIEETSK